MTVQELVKRLLDLIEHDPSVHTDSLVLLEENLEELGRPYPEDIRYLHDGEDQPRDTSVILIPFAGDENDEVNTGDSP